MVAEIEALEHLAELTLDAPQRLPNALSSSIRTLVLSGMKLDRTAGQMSGIEDLEVLSLVNLRGISDLSLFSQARALKRLYVDDCPELESIEGPRLVDNADVRFVGRTPLRQLVGGMGDARD